MEPLDWGDGEYSRTAASLAPAAEVVLDVAGLARGDRVLDMGCGTGNAALAAAARGATATGVDLSPRLVSLAAARAVAAGRADDCAFVVGDAHDPPVAHGAFDTAVSVFGVIFAQDPDRAIGGMRDALRQGGTFAMASWVAGGPVHAAGSVLRDAFPREGGPAQGGWDDPAWVGDLVARAGLRDVVQRREDLWWSAPSAEGWFAEQEEHHPVWRWARSLLAPERWDALREESVAALRAGSEDPVAFRARSPYVVTRAVR